MLTLAALQDWLQEQVGHPYCYGAKGDFRSAPGGAQVLCYDCSGFVTSAIFRAGGPDWRKTHGVALLFDSLPNTYSPAPLDLVFYGRPHVDHVMLWWGDGRVLGASGGGAECSTVQQAIALKAMVHFKASRDYRPDFAGFRKWPVPLAPPEVA